MALAAQLIPGFKYRILKGMLAEEVVTIKDNVPVPDGQDNQRKILVVGPNGHEIYILPRLIDERPVGVDGEVTVAPVIISAPVSEPQPRTTITDAVDTAIAAAKAPVAAKVVVQPITDPMDPRLDHLRPSRAKVRRYIKREMANGQTDVDYVLTFTSDEYRQRNEGRPANVMFKGDTSTGKTAFVEVLAVAWADALGLPKPMPIFTLSGSSGVTDFDLFGQTTSWTDPATGHEHLVWLPGVVDLAAQCGGILYLDEVNAMGERVTSSLHPLTDHRHMFVNRNKPVLKGGQFMAEVTIAHADLWVLASINEGYRGMTEMNEAWSQRFRSLLWDYDKNVEKELVNSPAIHILAEKLRTARAARAGVSTPIGTRSLQWLEQDIASFGLAAAMDTFKAMFKPNERPVVDGIIEDGSIYVMLQEEQRQARLNAAP